MPWSKDDAKRFTAKADTDKAKRLWAHVASKVLDETGDEGRAVREANAAVKRYGDKKRV